MSSKSLKELRAEKPAHLTVFWCDRCDKLINARSKTITHCVRSDALTRARFKGVVYTEKTWQ